MDCGVFSTVNDDSRREIHMAKAIDWLVFIRQTVSNLIDIPMLQNVAPKPREINCFYMSIAYLSVTLFALLDSLYIWSFDHKKNSYNLNIEYRIKNVE